LVPEVIVVCLINQHVILVHYSLLFLTDVTVRTLIYTLSASNASIVKVLATWIILKRHTET
jgi:hypothetical protein